MAANNIRASLEQLLGLHEELLELSKEKTEVIKVGHSERLSSITSKERNYIKAMNAAENTLRAETKAFLEQQVRRFEQPTLSDCFPYVDEQEREALSSIQAQLIETVSLFKKQNDLNQQLLEQSLAFVQMSLDVLTPDLETYNYERPNRSNPYERTGSSLFDSNA